MCRSEGFRFEVVCARESCKFWFILVLRCCDSANRVWSKQIFVWSKIKKHLERFHKAHVNSIIRRVQIDFCPQKTNTKWKVNDNIGSEPNDLYFYAWRARDPILYIYLINLKFHVFQNFDHIFDYTMRLTQYYKSKNWKHKFNILNIRISFVIHSKTNNTFKV